jgi:hypothetical protein
MLLTIWSFSHLMVHVDSPCPGRKAGSDMSPPEDIVCVSAVRANSSLLPGQGSNTEVQYLFSIVYLTMIQLLDLLKSRILLYRNSSVAIWAML